VLKKLYGGASLSFGTPRQGDDRLGRRTMGRPPCCDKTKVKRGPWSQEEDAVLRSFVERFGNAGNWISLPQKAGEVTASEAYC
jgi:hypothetical protein